MIPYQSQPLCQPVVINSQNKIIIIFEQCLCLSWGENGVTTPLLQLVHHPLKMDARQRLYTQEADHDIK